MKVSMKKNDGVSPVIGTILLVAITVVLVAIISAVVMGMTGDIGSSKIVGIQVSDNQSNSNGILVTITGGANAKDVSDITVYNGSVKLTPTVTSLKMNAVGVPYAFTATKGLATISVVANFTDGTQQSVYTGTLNIA
jgi:flagellin-like protein